MKKELAGLAKSMVEYTKETEIPILSEFAALEGLCEEIIIYNCSHSKEINEAVKTLETKKRGTLERKIYAGTINATIGVNLLKIFHEERLERMHFIPRINGESVKGGEKKF